MSEDSPVRLTQRLHGLEGAAKTWALERAQLPLALPRPSWTLSSPRLPGMTV